MFKSTFWRAQGILQNQVPTWDTNADTDTYLSAAQIYSSALWERVIFLFSVLGLQTTKIFHHLEHRDMDVCCYVAIPGSSRCRGGGGFPPWGAGCPIPSQQLFHRDGTEPNSPEISTSGKQNPLMKSTLDVLSNIHSLFWITIWLFLTALRREERF